MGRRGEQRIQAETQSIRGGTEFDGIPKSTGNRRRILKGIRERIMRKHDGKRIDFFFNDDEALISVQLSFLRYYALFDKLIHLSIGSVLMLYLEIKNRMTESIISVKHPFMFLGFCIFTFASFTLFI